jgi:hypothetical protein
MDIKQAAAIAKSQINELFSNEGAENIGLEEIDFDEEKSVWRVTVGFSRPWDRLNENPLVSAVADAYRLQRKRVRDMKVVTLTDADGTVVSVKNRE